MINIFCGIFFHPFRASGILLLQYFHIKDVTVDMTVITQCCAKNRHALCLNKKYMINPVKQWSGIITTDNAFLMLNADFLFCLECVQGIKLDERVLSWPTQIWFTPPNLCFYRGNIHIYWNSYSMNKQEMGPCCTLSDQTKSWFALPNLCLYRGSIHISWATMQWINKRLVRVAPPNLITPPNLCFIQRVHTS